MRKRKQQQDVLPKLLLAGFILLGTTHLFCRVDVVSHLEGLFHRASAEPMPQKLAQPGQPALGSIPEKEVAPQIQVETISRNPFMAPADYVVKKAPAHASGGAGMGMGPAVAAPEPQPMLKGVVRKGNTYAAIIELGGRSGFYRVGQRFGSHTVTDINANGVFVDGQQLSM